MPMYRENKTLSMPFRSYTESSTALFDNYILLFYQNMDVDSD